VKWQDYILVFWAFSRLISQVGRQPAQKNTCGDIHANTDQQRAYGVPSGASNPHRVTINIVARRSE
jgi:hypothetical protein